MTMARVATWSPRGASGTLRATRSRPRSLLSIPRLRSASSPNTHLHLQADTQCPDVLGLERRPLGLRRCCCATAYGEWCFLLLRRWTPIELMGYAGCAMSPQRTTILAYRRAEPCSSPATRVEYCARTESENSNCMSYTIHCTK